jgi:hypothetical protein
MAGEERALAGLSDEELEKLRRNIRPSTSLAAGAGPPSGENTVDLSSNNVMTGLGIARDVGLPMAGEAVGRLLPTSPVTGPIGAGLGEGAASLLRGDSFQRAGANALGAATFSAAMPFVGQKVMRAKRAPEGVKAFFRGERSIGAATKKVLAEADRFGPDDAKVFLRSALTGRETALKGKADKLLSQAVKRTGGGKIVPNKELRATLENVISAPLEEFGLDAKKAARFTLDLIQADESQTLAGANAVRKSLWKAFTSADPGDAKEIGQVVGLVDDVIESAVQDPRTVSLIQRSRKLRTLRRALFSDKGQGAPNLARFFDENKDLGSFIINNSGAGDFRQLVRQAARSPNADEAMTSIRSILLDNLDQRSAAQVAKEMKNAKSLLRVKLDAAFYPGFHKVIADTANDAAKFAALGQTFRQPVGSSRNTFGAGAGALMIPGNPLAAVAAGAAAPTAIEGLGRLGKVLNTGAGRRAGAAALGQGARAGTQRKLDQLRQASERGGVR